MTNRLLIGNLGGSTYGLKTSLPGVNVLTADENNSDQVSLSTNWSNIMRIWQITYGVTVDTPGVPATGHADVVYPELDYIPFIETRRIDAAARVFASQEVWVTSNSGITNCEMVFRAVGITKTQCSVNLRRGSPFPNYNFALFVFAKAAAV